MFNQWTSVPPPPEFNPDSEVRPSLATRWITWMDDFEMFLTASIESKTKGRNVSCCCTKPVLECGVREIFRQLTDTGNANDYKTAKDKFNKRIFRASEKPTIRSVQIPPSQTRVKWNPGSVSYAATSASTDLFFQWRRLWNRTATE
jgi:hypothetical protein